MPEQMIPALADDVYWLGRREHLLSLRGPTLLRLLEPVVLNDSTARNRGDAPGVDEDSLVLPLATSIGTALIRDVGVPREVRVVDGFPLFTRESVGANVFTHGLTEIRVRGRDGGRRVVDVFLTIRATCQEDCEESRAQDKDLKRAEGMGGLHGVLVLIR